MNWNISCNTILATPLSLKCGSAIMQKCLAVLKKSDFCLCIGLNSDRTLSQCFIQQVNLEVLYNFCIPIIARCCLDCFHHCVNRAFASLLVTGLRCFKIISKNYSAEKVLELSFLWAKWTVCQAFKGAFLAIVTLNTKLQVGQILSFSETSHQPSPD